MKTIDDIKETQHTIDLLLKLGSLSSQKEEKKKWVLEPLLHTDECSIGIVHINSKSLGPCDPHIHYEAKEYLICITGAFILNVDGNFVRTVTEGECAVVRAGQMHYSKPILDNTKIAYICIPADKGMSLLEQQLEESNGRPDN